jgi:hypothetical protein
MKHPRQFLISLKIVSLKQVCRENAVYSADNCSVNYGKNKSVFVKLKNSFDLPNLIAGHCNMHILPNMD